MTAPPTLVLPDCTIELERRTVRHATGVTRLSNREAQLLAYLAARANEPVSREELLEHVCGLAPTAQTRTVDTTVASLRKNIEADPAHPVYLQTEYGVGYRFVFGTVEERSTEPRPKLGTHNLGECVVDLDQARVVGGETLSARELRVLRALIDVNGGVVTREHLLESVWGRHDDTRALDHTVRRLRLKVANDAITKVRGVGLRLTHPPVKPAAQLVGRETEVKALHRLVGETSWVSVVGPGGVGKTALVKAALPTAWFVDLTQSRTQKDVLARILAVLGLKSADPAALHLSLRTRGRVLILDNCEQLEPGALRLMQEMVARGGVRVVATSRERCGGPEAILSLKPLERGAAGCWPIARPSLGTHWP